MTKEQDTRPTETPRTVTEAWTEAGRALARLGEQLSSSVQEALDQLNRTVHLLLPKPTTETGDAAVWAGDGWQVELVGDQISITGGCEHGDTTAVAAAMIAADRLREERHPTEGQA